MSARVDVVPLEDLAARARHANSRVWSAACVELGDRAVASFEAREEVEMLVESPHREYRLRGFVAVGQMAPHRPLDVSDFVLDIVGGHDIDQDPVLADAVFALVARLPVEFALRTIEGAVNDPRDTVRAAAAASLGRWRGWSVDLLEHFAKDPSPEVRAALAVSMPSLKDVPESRAALRLLNESAEDYVRKFVQEMTGSMGEQPPVQDDPATVRGKIAALLDRGTSSLRRGIQATELLSQQPHHAAEILLPLLEVDGIPMLLDQIAWRVRDTRVADVCRRLHSLLKGATEAPAARLVLLDEALEEQVGPAVSIFQAWVRLCREASTVTGVEQIHAWLRRHASLSQFLAAFERGGISALEAGPVSTLAVEQRAVMQQVLECWRDVLDEEILAPGANG